MLGEKIGSISGPATNKVLSAEGSLPKFSTSTEGVEHLLEQKSKVWQLIVPV